MAQKFLGTANIASEEEERLSSELDRSNTRIEALTKVLVEYAAEITQLKTKVAELEIAIRGLEEDGNREH